MKQIFIPYLDARTSEKIIKMLLLVGSILCAFTIIYNKYAFDNINHSLTNVIFIVCSLINYILFKFNQKKLGFIFFYLMSISFFNYRLIQVGSVGTNLSLNLTFLVFLYYLIYGASNAIFSSLIFLGSIIYSYSFSSFDYSTINSHSALYRSIYHYITMGMFIVFIKGLNKQYNRYDDAMCKKMKKEKLKNISDEKINIVQNRIETCCLLAVMSKKHLGGRYQKVEEKLFELQEIAEKIKNIEKYCDEEIKYSESDKIFNLKEKKKV